MAGEVNRLAEMEVFVKVVQSGGMTAAARARSMTPSAVSKLIARLEGRLNVRLINRSTRSFELTPEGRTFYDAAIDVLEGLATAERVAGNGSAPSGRIRVNTSSGFGFHVLAPILPEFLDQYPDIQVELAFTDATVDLLAERTDVAIRSGPLKSSTMVARKLGESRFVVVGSPGYIAKHGLPEVPTDLQSHRLLGLSYARSVDASPFDDVAATVPPLVNSVQSSEAAALLHLAVAGAGFAQLPHFAVRKDVAAGNLEIVLERFTRTARERFFAVYLGRGHMPTRTRVFLDFLVDRVDLDGSDVD